MINKILLKTSLLISAFFILLPFAFSQSGQVETIYFKSNSSSIDRKYKIVLDIIAKQLSSDTFGFLKIFGFADTKGSADYNDVLSEKRATEVYNYLAGRVKIDSTRVYVTWLGESAEIYDLHFPEANKQKRCVDILIQFYKKE
jgi:OOP family OmpA-OmpF porin